MTRKDWILLGIPIISNGLLIYIFQLLMQRKVDKLKIIQERKKEIINTFLKLIQESVETVSEVENKFRFREELNEINEEFQTNISKLHIYGTNNSFIIKDIDCIEKIRAKSGFCLTLLNRYKACKYTLSDYPLDEQLRILEYTSEIRTLLIQLMSKTIKL